MSAVQQVLRRRRQQKKEALQSRAFQDLEKQVIPRLLLNDQNLMRSTRLTKLEFGIGRPSTEAAREALRHDYCVLLCQQELFSNTHHHILPEPSSDFLAKSQPDLTHEFSSGSRYAALKSQSGGSDAVFKYMHKSSWQLIPPPVKDDKLAHSSLCWMQISHCLRSRCIWLIRQWWFDSLVLLLILINCVLMIVDLEVAEKSQALQKLIVLCEELFLYMFTIEAVIKIIALGLVCSQFAYLRDNWNKLDMLVVCAGWFSLIYNQLDTCNLHGAIFCAKGARAAGTANYGSLRTVRILRPLRTINRFPSMRRVVTSLISAVPELLDSMVLFAFVVILFGTIGVQLFSGIFLRACVDPLTGAHQEPSPMFCQPDSKPSDTWGGCRNGYECRDGAGSNPSGGVTSFDHLGYAALAVLQIITLEGWSDIMVDVREAKGLRNDLYFISLVLFGSFFMMNLVVAVLVENFDTVTALEKSPKRDSLIGGEANYDMKVVCLENDLTGSVRKRCLQMILSSSFNNAVLLLIIMNTTVLALDNVIEESILETLNYIFSAIFLLEMVLKLYGLGPTLYSMDTYNLFDAVVVVVSVAETVFSALGTEGLVHLTVLRTFRLMRVFKLARRMRSLAKVLNTIWASLGQIRDLGLLILVFTVVCALLGMSVFPCTEADKDSPNAKWGFLTDGPYKGKLVRPNYSNFFYAMVTTFVLLTGENWNEIMFVAVQNNNWMSALYFVVVVVFGNYIILNLFLAILIDNFDKLTKKEQFQDSQDNSMFNGVTDNDNGQDELDVSVSRTVSPSASKTLSPADSQTSRMSLSPRSPSVVQRESSVKKLTIMHGLVGDSLFCFSAESWFRNSLWTVVTHPFFDQFYYGLIVVSALALALDSPDQKSQEVKEFVRVMDYVLTVFFTLEALCKTIVYGLFWGKNCYLHDSWNVLDFFVVITAIGNLILQEVGAELGISASGLGWLKALRAVRALRPLRMVSRNEGMKAVVNSILVAIPAIGEVLMVLILFLCIFSILGVQFFKNRLSRCSCMEWCPDMRFNPASSHAHGKPIQQLCQGSCMTAPAHAKKCVWERHPFYSFDNSIYAMLALFEVSTLEMWPDVMWLAVDGTSQDEGPMYDRTPYAVLFFVIFIFVMSFFIVNLFVGTVIDKFTVVRNEMNGLLVLTPRQQNWIRTQKRLLKLRPRPLLTPPNDKWRQLVLQLISLREFEVVVMGVIAVNVIVMCTYHYGASPGIERMQENANRVFLGCFMLEAILKLYAMHWRLYFRDSWNCFDFAVLVISLVTESSVMGQTVSIDATMLRILRAARMFRLVKSFNSLRKLFTTLVASLPSLVNVGATLLLLFYVYAIAGMALFGDIKVDENPYIKYMGKDVNFRSFYLTMVMLFRMTTGESWNGIMHECFSGAMCEASPHARDCGSTVAALIFFISFMLLGTFVFLNLFIAVIIQNLFETEVESEDSPFLTLKPNDLDDFVEAWSRIAPDGSWYIPTYRLDKLLSELRPPLGFGNEVTLKFVMLRLLKGIGLHDFAGRAHFAETLWRLASMVDGEEMLGQASKFEVQRALNKDITRVLPLPTRKMAMGYSLLYSAHQAWGVLQIQRVWRSRLTRRQLEKQLHSDNAVKAMLVISRSFHCGGGRSPSKATSPEETPHSSPGGGQTPARSALNDAKAEAGQLISTASLSISSEHDDVVATSMIASESSIPSDGASQLAEGESCCASKVPTTASAKLHPRSPCSPRSPRSPGNVRCIDCGNRRFSCICCAGRVSDALEHTMVVMRPAEPDMFFEDTDLCDKRSQAEIAQVKVFGTPNNDSRKRFWL